MSMILRGIHLFLPLLAFQESSDIRQAITKIAGISYPRLAAQAGIKGEVVMTYRISPEGKAEILDVKGDHALLEESAVHCLSLWRFKLMPAGTKEIKPQTLHFTFKLKGVCANTSCATHFEVDFPNHVLIESSSPHWQPDVSDQLEMENAFSRKGTGRERMKKLPKQSMQIE